MWLNRYLCSVFLLTIPLNIFAQTFKPVGNPAKMLADLKGVSGSTGSIQADFREEKHMAALKKAAVSSGSFFYSRSDKMRWEQKAPVTYVILINGDKLRVQEDGKEKNVATASRVAAQMKELMIGLVNGDFQKNTAFSQTYFESQDQYLIVLTPVSNRLKRIYSKISLTFGKSTLRLQKLTFDERGGDSSTMTFNNEKFNQPIAESVFLKF
jgi:outer membrane lipoprotein-sorting protein